MKQKILYRLQERLGRKFKIDTPLVCQFLKYLISNCNETNNFVGTPELFEKNVQNYCPPVCQLKKPTTKTYCNEKFL